MSPLVMLNRSSSVILNRQEVSDQAGRWALRERQAEVYRRSSRPLDLAARVLHRSGRLLAGNGVLHREHVVRIALRGMRFADEDGAHQLMIACTVGGRVRLQRDFR